MARHYFENGSYSCPNIYKFEHGGKTFLFEIHSYCGPWPVDENYDPIDETKEFWDMWDEFNQLSDEDRKEFLIFE